MARQIKPLDQFSAAGSPAAKGLEIRAKYATLDWTQLLVLLADRSLVHYPCEIRFDAAPLLPGEFAHSTPKGIHPEDGFIIYVHPHLQGELSDLPHAILHQLALIEFGDFIGAEQAETFGCNALGISPDDYYHTLCRLADRVSSDELG